MAWVSVRLLLKRPGITSLAVIALGLGIGLTTTMFSIVNGVMLRGLPFDEPDRIVVVGAYDKKRPEPPRPGDLSAADYCRRQGGAALVRGARRVVHVRRRRRAARARRHPAALRRRPPDAERFAPAPGSAHQGPGIHRSRRTAGRRKGRADCGERLDRAIPARPGHRRPSDSRERRPDRDRRRHAGLVWIPRTRTRLAAARDRTRRRSAGARARGVRPAARRNVDRRGQRRARGHRGVTRSRATGKQRHGHHGPGVYRAKDPKPARRPRSGRCSRRCLACC